MAVKDSIGGWKDNACLYRTPKACSEIKRSLGKVFVPFLGGLGYLNATCPIPAVSLLLAISI